MSAEDVWILGHVLTSIFVPFACHLFIYFFSAQSYLQLFTATGATSEESQDEKKRENALRKTVITTRISIYADMKVVHRLREKERERDWEREIKKEMFKFFAIYFSLSLDIRKRKWDRLCKNIFKWLSLF